jgi:hypothetical protein
MHNTMELQGTTQQQLLRQQPEQGLCPARTPQQQLPQTSCHPQLLLGPRVPTQTLAVQQQQGKQVQPPQQRQQRSTQTP